jgi:hypothetical protein
MDSVRTPAANVGAAVSVDIPEHDCGSILRLVVALGVTEIHRPQSFCVCPGCGEACGNREKRQPAGSMKNISDSIRNGEICH